MKKIITYFIYTTALCLLCSGLAPKSNAQEIRPDETRAVAEETQDASSVKEDIVRYPLRPPDTSSPQATLHSFVDYMNRAYRLLMTAHRNNLTSPGLLNTAPVQQMARDAQNLFERGVSCLDLSKVSRARRRNVGYEGALMLKEILDRIDLPPLQEIPDAQAVKEELEQKKFPEFIRWRVPNTTLVIARVDEGPRQGEFLFTPDTVARLHEFYRKVQDLPYKSDAVISHDFLNFYNSTPGRLLPPKWSQWIPAWSTVTYLSQAMWQWGALVVVVSLTVVVVVAIYRVLRPRTDTRSPANRLWRWVVFFLLAAMTVIVSYAVLDDYVNITGAVRMVFGIIHITIAWVVLATAVFFFAGAVAETIIASPTIDPEGLRASYLRALFGVVGFLATAAILIYGLSQVGVSLAPLLAGIGLGGLAIAMAARPTLENIIGSFMIFADKPYRVGQRVNVMGQDGTVEAIGLRSTKIRLLSGHLTSIPNEKMAAVEIENIAYRPYIRRVLNVTITYDTPPAKITRAVEILREILAVPEPPEAVSSEASEEWAETAGTEEFVETFATEGEAEPHPNEAINQPDFPPRVYFNDLNADSLNILVIYWYHPPLFWDYVEHAHGVNLQIMECFHAEGIDFAFPTQTLHLAGDDKRPLTVDQRGVSNMEDDGEANR